jgi:hypothetical protein
MTRPKIVWGLLLISVFSSGCGVASVPTREEALFWQLESDELFEDGPTFCSLHGVRTVLQAVPVVDGMCLRHFEYRRAKMLRFPYSYLRLRSCSCESIGPSIHALRNVCPICRRNELRWWISNGWSIPMPEKDGATAEKNLKSSTARPE